MDQETTEILIRFKEKKVASGLSASKLAEILGYGKSAVEHWLNQHNAPNDEALERIKKWIDQDDTQINETTNQDILDHVDQLKRLFNCVEYELKYFITGQIEKREIFRQELDAYDISYLTSCLDSIVEEGRFRRWQMMSTYQYNSFRRVKNVRKGKNKS